MNERSSGMEARNHPTDFYQEKLEMALAELGMRYWEYDIRSKRLYRSALIQNEVGYSAYKENVPESYVEESIIHPAYAGAYLDFYHNLAKGIEGRLVFQSKYADGHWGWLDISYAIYYDETGAPVKAVGIGGDISLYSSITIFQLRKNQFSVLYANDVFYQLSGYTKEQYNRDPAGCLEAELDDETKALTTALIQRAMQTGELQTMEYPLRRPDGKVLWLYRKFLVVPQQEEGCYLVPAITKDVTERHIAEKKLADERNMYQSLLDESSALMTVVDAETFEVVYANRAALEATKLLKNGYVGNTCFRCIQNRDKPCPSCLLSRSPSPKSETKDTDYGGRTYRMTYKKIFWNGRKALLECSEDITEQKRNLMLVEDHPLNAEIAMRMLQKVGCEVDWLKNGADAVKRFAETDGEPYDLVLMDIRMPVMDGLEAAKRIRAMDGSHAKTMPMIVMTANAYEEDIRHSLEAGMDAHLSKPIDNEIFFDTLLRCLSRPHQGPEEEK